MTNIIDSIKDLISDAKSVKDASQNLTDSLAKLEQVLGESQEQIDDINKSVEEFKFKTQPRIDHIQELQEKMQKEIDKFN